MYMKNMTFVLLRAGKFALFGIIERLFLGAAAKISVSGYPKVAC